MARWSVVTVMNASSNLAAETVQLRSLVALLSTVVVFTVCVTMLLALCAAHSSSSSSSHAHVLNARREEFSSGPELAIAPPEEFKKQDLHSGPLSFRFSSGSNSNNNSGLLTPTVLGLKLGAGASSAINKLSSSFRISSFRDPSSSFRNSSFRVVSCKQVDGVVDSLRKVRPAGLEEESSEPAVWQRAILRGERCSPLSFSGLILYDENGNQLPSFDEETKEQDEFSFTSGSELENGF